MAQYKVVILNSSRTPITEIKSHPRLDTTGVFLQYTSKLREWGKCKFRVGSKDPAFETHGDILQPFKYHVQVYRNTEVVWQGVIVDNPRRNKDFIEVEARTYAYMLSTLLVRHNVAPDDVNFRTFKTGTMANNISTLITELKADAGTNMLASMTTGTIENPVFPQGFVIGGVDKSGLSWEFSNDLQLDFDDKHYFHILDAFATYAQADWELTTDLALNFYQYKGNTTTGITFEYGPLGAVEDYEAPLSGDSQSNEIRGVAVDADFNVIRTTANDSASKDEYGLLQGVAAYTDLNNSNLLKSRINEELRHVAYPNTELFVVLGEKGNPIGSYEVGDTVKIKINDRLVNVDQDRRVNSIETKVHLTGKETYKIGTELPRSN